MKLAELYAEFREKGLTRLTGGIKTLHARLAKANVAMEKIGRIAKRVFIVAGGAMALAVREAVKFEKQMAMVSTMLGETTMQYMDRFSRGIRKLSVDYGESTATLAKGLYDVLSASIAPGKALAVLEVSTRAAQAGFTDTGTAADAITTVLNSYGLSADRAAEVSDKLFATVKRGKLTFGELASSIGKASATAAMAGLSLDELLASVATITRAGIRSDQAMTAVVGTLRSFLAPTSEAKKLAKSLGFEMSTSTLRAEGWIGVLKKINRLTPEQTRILFPNIRGLKGVAAAMQDMTGYGTDVALMLNSLGMTEEALLKRQATLGFQLSKLKQSFLDLVRAVGEELLPALRGVVKWFEKVLSGVKENWAAVTKSIASFLKWSIAISGTIIALKALFSIILAITAHPLVALSTILAAVVVATISWGRAVDHIKSKLEGWADSVESLDHKVKTFIDDAKQVGGIGLEAAHERLTLKVKRLRKEYEELWAKWRDMPEGRREKEMPGRMWRTRDIKVPSGEAVALANKMKEVRAEAEATEKALIRYGPAFDKARESADLQKWDKTFLGSMISGAKSGAKGVGRWVTANAKVLMDWRKKNMEVMRELAMQRAESGGRAEEQVIRTTMGYTKEADAAVEKAKLRVRLTHIDIAEQKELEAAIKTEKNRGFIRLKYDGQRQAIEERFAMGQAEKLGAQAKRRVEQSRQDQMTVIQAVGRAGMQLLPQRQRKEMEAERWGARMRERAGALGGAGVAGLQALIDAIVARMKGVGAAAGQWQGFADVYRQVQSAMIKPEIKLAKEQVVILKKLYELELKMSKESRTRYVTGE